MWLISLHIDSIVCPSPCHSWIPTLRIGIHVRVDRKIHDKVVDLKMEKFNKRERRENNGIEGWRKKSHKYNRK